MARKSEFIGLNLGKTKTKDMDAFILGDDIKVMCVSAANFPGGIITAHQHLHSLLPDVEERRYFGISSRDDSGTMIYRAAAEEMHPGESQNLGLDSFTIKHGAYMSFYIANYRENNNAIQTAFNLLRGQQEADPNSYDIEWYIGENDVKCLVRSGPEDYPE